MGGNFGKFVEQSALWCAQDVVDLLDLVHFIIAWEEWEQRQYLEEDAAHSPVVHLVIVVSISHQALGWSVPPCTDVFSKRRLRVDAPARTEIR